MSTYYGVRSSRPAGLFSFGLLDGLPVHLRRPYLREDPERELLFIASGTGIAPAFINNPG